MLITVVAGARPNFMKIAPIIKTIKAEKGKGYDIDFRLVHTGQHFDKKMSGEIFEELNIPQPDINLECSGGSQAEQTAAIMVKFEMEILKYKPDLVLVVGDVTSTMACTIVAKKLCIDVAHVEAGIRSGDKEMPEEINRIVTDAICDYFFTTSRSASDNLKGNNVKKENIFFVGNTMIDTLMQNIKKIKQPSLWNQYKLKEKEFILLTLHRPSNVDDPLKLLEILNAVKSSLPNLTIVFPVHPRTLRSLEILNVVNGNLIFSGPLSYLEFIYLLKNAKAVITDSGGITEEATVLNIPCLTLRKTTERPETVTEGTNILIGDDMSKLKYYLSDMKNGTWKGGSVPELWDGKTSQRIVEHLKGIYGLNKIN